MYLLQSTRHLLALLIGLFLMACQAKAYTAGSLSRTPQRPSAIEDLSPEQLHQHQPSQQADSARRQGGGAAEEGEEDEGRSGDGGCEEGWLHTHHHCLLDTGLGAGRQADLVCRQQGALEARGICIKKAPMPDLSSLEASMTEEEDQGTSLTSSVESKPSFVCPSGWTQYDKFCLIRPGSIPEICHLLGANYVFNYCVIRVPHKVSVDFMRAVKRLDGSDYNLHRDTRLCCCSGRYLCK